MGLQNEFIEKVGQAVAESLMKRAKLKVETKGFYLGEEEDIHEIQKHIVRLVVEAIRTKAQAIKQAPSIEELEAIIREGISDQFRKLKKLEVERATQALEETLAEQPSLLDRIAVAPLPPFEKHRLQQMEQELEDCVLKVVDRDDKGREIVSTAFVLCEQGHVLTAAHVALQEDRPLTIEHRGQEGFAQVELIDRNQDLAIMRLEEEVWDRIRDKGAKPPPLSLREAAQMRGDPILCLGYQEHHVFLDPIWASGWISPHYPLRKVQFRDGHRQTCLVLIMGAAHIVEGMSGGPVLSLETGEVVAMVTGATRRVFQKWRDLWEETSPAVYGFAVPISNVAASWPEIERCCFQGSAGLC